MANYRYAAPRRRINFKGISAILLIIVAMSTVGMGIYSYFTIKNIKNAESSIAQIEKDKITLQEELDSLEETTKALEDEVNALQEILWRFEPVIIPDSMK